MEYGAPVRSKYRGSALSCLSVMQTGCGVQWLAIGYCGGHEGSETIYRLGVAWKTAGNLHHCTGGLGTSNQPPTLVGFGIVLGKAQ